MGWTAIFSDTMAGISLRRDIARWSPHITLDCSLGAAVHFTEIRGTLTASMQDTGARRTNLAGHANARLVFALFGPWRASAYVAGTYTPWRQHYEVSEERVYSVARLAITAGVGISTVLDW